MKKKKKILGVVLLAVFLLLAACGNQPASGGKSEEKASGDQKSTETKKKVSIGITQIIEHPALDASREGFIQALKDNGFADADIDFQSAQGDPSMVSSIAQKFAADKKDAILAIATSSAQSVVKATEGTDIPVFFTAITDPLGAKLVDNLEKPGKNVTGYSDTHPEAINKLVALMKELMPDKKTVGIIYNSGEANSVVNVNNAKKAMDKNGLKAVEVNAGNTSEVKQAADSLVGKVDMLYIPKDNTAVAALKTIVQVAEQNKIPMFVGEMDSVRNGGFAGFGADYKDLGYKTGLMAVKVLKGEAKPGDLPVQFPKELNLGVNKEAAANEGIDLGKLKAQLDKYNPVYFEKN
ncbi:ABC transporter substrate-binding protein [Aneurinibacillus tyrosinisolvens]|uniref:ABC transporter substrate-binding protein n=1 Tax=Aneurinibacillus tyrosinisolvens TaxID=1443435 RepID=UPI00063F4C04|nr:ABC transporter substrate-binding protein [Aneurinibacillus tyrosinisolvens]